MAAPVLRSSETRNWYDFNFDIRHLILENLAEAEYHDKNSLTGYVRVARDWQPVFEKFTFSKLRIKPSELRDFRAIFRVMHRRKYLQRLGLVLQLPEHKHIPLGSVRGTEEQMAMAQMLIIAGRGANANSRFPELERLQTQNNVAFTKAICALLFQLRTWTREEVCLDGIGLEIIAESESYWQKMARSIQNRNGPKAIYTEVLPRTPCGLQRFRTINIQPQAWRNCLYAAELDFHFSLNLDFTGSPIPSPAALPRVRVITSVSILRKTVRHFHPGAVGAIIRCLPYLAVFNWEVQPRAHWEVKHEFDRDLVEAISSWPSSLKEVRISQIEHLHPPSHYNQVRPNLHLKQLGSKLAYMSQQLNQLSIEHNIDAGEFFTIASQQQWPNLQQLCLRSEQNILDEVPHTTNLLLRTAAFAALRMPELRNLALYNVDSSGAGCFTYELLDGVAVFNVKCSWSFELNKDCFDSWEAVAREHHEVDVRWQVKRVPVQAVRFGIYDIARGSIVASWS